VLVHDEVVPHRDAFRLQGGDRERERASEYEREEKVECVKPQTQKGELLREQTCEIQLYKVVTGYTVHAETM
jgi:hypothetical protein